MKDKNKNPGEHYIYFIETHEINKKFELSISQGIKVELLYEEITNQLKNLIFTSLVYRFKIKNMKEKLPITIQIEDKKKNKYEKKIIKDMVRGSNIHFFLYNVEFRPTKGALHNIHNSAPSYIYHLSDQQQYQLYNKSIIEKFKDNEQERMIKELILSTQLLFIKGRQFEFLFYLKIFRECYESIIVKKQLYSFRLERIKGLGDQKLNKIEEIQKDINLIKDNPDIVLKISRENEKIILSNCLYSIIFYFNYNFQKEKINDLLEDDNINQNLFKQILEHSHMFPNLLISKEALNIFIKCAENFSQIKDILKYNNNVNDILLIINDNLDFIFDKYKSNQFNERNKSKKKNNPLKIEEYAEPKENDDIGSIIGLIKSINLFQKENEQFIIFSPVFFKKYMDFYDGQNYENLLFLKEIIENMISFDHKFKLKHFNKIFHKNGLKFIKEKKLKNIDILDFIQRDKYYDRKHKKYSPNLIVLEGIQFKDINEKFIKDWEEIAWTEIFKGKEKQFIETICSLVENISQFDKLFLLLYKKKEFYIHRYTVLKTIQEEFIHKCSAISNEKLKEYLYVIIDIIKFSDILQCGIEEFLRKIIDKFNKEFVQNVFINVLNDYNNCSQKAKKLMLTTIEKNIDFENQDNIFQILKIIGNKNSEILSRLSKYIIDEEEFFELDDTLNFKILKLLISQNILPDKNSNNSFLRKSFQKIENIKEEINKFHFTYNIINKFFETENKKTFFQRWALIYFININKNDIILEENGDININFNNMKNNIKVNNIRDIKKYIEDNIINPFASIFIQYKTLHNNINSLQIILDDFLTFYQSKNKEYCNELIEIINKYKEKYLFQTSFDIDKRIIFFLDEYLNGALERAKLKKSLLYNSIYEKEKINNTNGEDKILAETYKKFQDLKNIFNNDINNANENIIKFLINEFRNKSDDEIKEEILKLIDIFKIDNFNNYNFINDLIVLLKKQNILNVLKSLMKFIEDIEVKKEQYTKSITTTISICEKYFGTELINMCIDTLKCFGIDLNDNNNQFCNILMKLNKIPDIIKFLLKVNIDDCRLMQEIVNNEDDRFLTGADITDFEKCVEFITKIRTDEKLKEITDYKLIKKSIDLFNDNPDLALYFNNFIDHFGEIYDLHEKGFNKSEAANQKIKDICNNSIFILSNKTKNYFEGKYEKEIENQKIEENQEKKSPIVTITLKELQELKDRIQMTRNISIDLKNNENLENEQLFIELISDLTNIYSILNEIYSKGYIKEIQVKVKISQKMKSFEFIDEEIKKKKEEEKVIAEINEIKENEENNINYDSKSLILKLRTLLNNLKKSQLDGYENNAYLRYIYGREFNSIYNYLNRDKYIKKDKKEDHDNNKDEYNDIFPFLKYITNNEFKSFNEKFEWKKEGDEFKNAINNFNKYIEETLNYNGIKLENIYSNSIIQSKFDEQNYTGFYIYSCNKLEKELFQLYKYLTGHIPIAQNILLCNKETSKEEIESFLYRSILCQFHSCFIIGGIESLEFIPKNYLVELIKKLLSKYNKDMKSILIILSANKDTDIHKSLESINNRKFFKTKIEKEIAGYTLDSTDNIAIISSDKSGVGKSTKIRNEIINNSKKYKYFPLGGVFTRSNIIQRLNKLNITEKTAIHLDLYDTDCIDLMLDFLFSIIITKIYRQNEKIIYLPKDIEIKIEIPNGFINFFEKFPILTLIPQKPEYKMSIKNLEPLIVPKDVSSNVQIVANYLKQLKNKRINDIDLDFPGITPEVFRENYVNEFKTIIQAEVLSQEECQELIFEAIKKDKNISYYQIKSFIDVLSVQLKKFTKSFFFNAFDLHFRANDLKNIRTFVVENFIKLTSYFTEGAFTRLINEQKLTHNIMFGQYDEGKDIQEAINSLARNDHYKISFDKIDPSLVFFHEGNGEMFSIITNKKPDSEEYKKFLDLKNSQLTANDRKNNKSIKSLPDYIGYNQIDFLRELKEILNIKNPVTIKEKEQAKKEREKRKKEMEEKEKKKEQNLKKKIKRIEKNEKSEEKKEPEVKDFPNIEDKDEDKKELLSLEEISKNYVFTPDNFVKMILILIRIRSNVPVIMMGETGCGKTSLIRKLSEMLNNGELINMKTLNIHAGTNDEEIINFINGIEEDAKKLREEETKNMEKFQNKEKELLYEEKKLWVFLDEINTCKSMGLISELMCKHSCQGKQLNDNIVFIAACNPYRQTKETKGKKEEIGLKVNQAYKEMEKMNEKERKDLDYKITYGNNKLVYTVNPLPHSLLNFVFDFGSLSREDEKKYIENMIQEPIERIYKNNKDGINNENDLIELKTFAKNMIVEAQNFIRDNNDVSSVSLREIRRFVIFYEFFFEYLKNKKEKLLFLIEDQMKNNKISFKYDKLTNFDCQIYAVNLSIFICYYLRITNKKLREELVKILNKTFKFKNKKFDFLELPILEEKFIADNIELKKGIAKNKALLENIFSLFFCINNKIPIFIVGKPGCSKSLSVQLINKSMKGSSSNNDFFKIYPKIILHSYQGSLGSTSEGVMDIFKKARRSYAKQRDENKKEIISTIYFDEMGLAEHSPNNPLKVIHSELEYDQNENDKKIAFVGISNWILDASKMNRGIHISIPDLDEEDNKNTALTIAESYDNLLAFNFKPFFENLGTTYFKYKNFLREKHNLDGKQDFHGNRDFYHFVKNASIKLLNDMNNNKLSEIGIESIERNFGGLEFNDYYKSTSIGIVKKEFKNIYQNCDDNKKYNVIKRIEENINDPKSRYLLVISKSSVSSHLLSFVLGDKNYNYFIGSRFIDDLKSEEYQFKIINKIQLFMEKGETIILKDLESVYPALYDVFNQNFTVTSNKNYARISIGTTSNNYSYVNDNFKCIVDVGKDKIDNQEPPFLNRFEKHILTFEYLLQKQELISKSNELYDILNNNLLNICKNCKFINYDIKKLLINCELEEIQGLIYKSFKNGIEENNIIQEVISKIALTLPQDIIVPLKFNDSNSNNKTKKLILESYNKGEHRNLLKFLEVMEQRKNVIYTFSVDFDLHINKEITNKKLNFTINVNNNIKKLKIRGIKTENSLERRIDKFLESDQYKICLIQFTPDEGNLMDYIKFFIENREKEKKQNKKIFIFTVHMARLFYDELKECDKKNENEKKKIDKKILKETMSNLSDYYQIFIDNLNGDENINIKNIIGLEKDKILYNLLNLDQELIGNIYQTITYIKYHIKSLIESLNEDNYTNKMISLIERNQNIRNLINNFINNKLISENKIIEKIFEEKNKNNGERDDIDFISKYDIDILNVIKKYLFQLYISQLNQFYFSAENYNFLSSLLFFDSQEENKNILNAIEEDMNLSAKSKVIKIITNNFFEFFSSKSDEVKIKENPGINDVNILLGLELPGFKNSIENILNNIREKIIKDFKENELNFINNEGKNMEENYEKKYLKEIIRYSNLTKNIIQNDELIQKIYSKCTQENEIVEFYDLLLNDYFIFIINDNDLDKNSVDNSKKFLNLIADLIDEKFSKRINENNDKEPINENKRENPIKTIANKINWIECYKGEIISLLKIYLRIDSKVYNLYKTIVEINNYYKSINKTINIKAENAPIINSIIFQLLDLLLKIFTSKVLVDNKEENETKISDIINFYKEIYQDSKKIQDDINIYSNECYTLEEIIEIFNIFNSNNIIDKEKYNRIIDHFIKESKIDENDDENLYQNFYELYILLNENIGTEENFPKIMNIILACENSKIKNEEFRGKLLNIILQKNEFIIDSSYLIKSFMNEVLKYKKENYTIDFDLIKDNQNQLLNLLNNSNKIFLDEILLDYFEGIINLYFKKIEINEESNININKLINYKNIIEESFNIFEKALKYLVEKENINNLHICQLYAISFLKIYLNIAIFLTIKSDNNITIIADIAKKIKSISYNELSRVIKLYILKLFYFYLDSDYNKFMEYNFKDIEFVTEFEWDKKSEEEKEQIEENEVDDGEKIKEKGKENLDLYNKENIELQNKEENIIEIENKEKNEVEDDKKEDNKGLEEEKEKKDKEEKEDKNEKEIEELEEKNEKEIEALEENEDKNEKKIEVLEEKEEKNEKEIEILEENDDKNEKKIEEEKEDNNEQKIKEKDEEKNKMEDTNKDKEEIKEINNVIIEQKEDIKEKEDDSKNLRKGNSIIQEFYSPDKYSEEEYPLFKYFMLTKYSNKKVFLEELKNNNKNYKYPLLNQLLSLDKNSNLNKLNYLDSINNFSNYMIDKYSYKILRNEALTKDLDENDKSKLKETEFIKSWKEIKNDANSYGEFETMKSIELTDKNKLIYFLNDNIEKGYGMHIAGAYQSFISWQNKFLEPIIEENNNKNGILHFYNHNLKNKIYIQDAKPSNILSFKNINLENIINKYSKRDIFNKDGTINYKNYNTFVFDFDSIEKELGEKMLSEKCLFYPNLNRFIKFWSEENPEILTEFIGKYPQKELSVNEKNIIIEFLKKLYEVDNYDPKGFFTSFHLIFYYLNHYQEKIDEQNINIIIKNMPTNINLSGDFRNFFQKEGNNFKINQLMNIFVYVEHICFELLSKNLGENLKKTLNTKIKNEILSTFNDKEEKLQLAIALRRYISRYLIGNKYIQNIDKNSLHLELNKSDLWGVDSKKINEIKKLLNKLAKFNLEVSNSYDLYKSIGNDDESFLQLFNKKYPNNEQDFHGDQEEDEIDISDDDDAIEIKNRNLKIHKYMIGFEDEEIKKKEVNFHLKNEEEEQDEKEDKEGKKLIQEYYEKDSDNEEIDNDDNFNLI